MQNQKKEQPIKTLSCEYTYICSGILKIRLNATKYVCVYMYV